MGNEYNKRAVGQAGGLVEPVETVTLGSTSITVNNNGVTFATYGSSGVAADMILPDPTSAGVYKSIFVDNQTTSLEANINTSSTAIVNVFFGSTFNTATLNSTAIDAPVLNLVGVSTSQWAIVSLGAFNTTGAGDAATVWSLSATTGSTGQS